MAHDLQKSFCASVRDRFPDHFRGGRVLDVGSLDLNGSTRDLFDGSEYIGLDLGEGKGVDVVSIAHEYEPESPFDVVISTEMLEHDIHWRMTLPKMVEFCRPGGLVVMTCAGPRRGEHGTLRHRPLLSPFTTLDPEWGVYFHRVSKDDIRSALDCNVLFSEHVLDFGRVRQDLYFWGLKREAG